MLFKKQPVKITNVMEITKAHWSNDDGNVSISVPISKIDVESRQVSGFASVDNLDEHGDIITAECAYDAFSRFRGNLREMHQNIAVGKVVDFDQKPLYDAQSDKIYSGIYVTAYVSTGAQDTWEKVLDGTLSGFSIGGSLVESEEIFDKEINKMKRVVTKMNLQELSLVDNPANQLANVVAITKVLDGVAKGIAVDVETETVFWCESSQISLISKTDEPPACPDCDCKMENIGWIESGLVTEKSIREIVDSHIVKNSGKGGVEYIMSESVEETPIATEDVVEEAVQDAVEEIEDSAEDTTEQSEDIVVEVEDSVIEDSTVDEAEVQEDVVEASSETVDIESIVAELSRQLTSMQELFTESLAGVTKSIESTLDEAKKASASADTVKSELEKFESQFSEVSSRVDALAKGTAVKKSGEDGDSPEEIKKSLWSGSFLSANEL